MLGMVSLLSLLLASQAVVCTATAGGAVQKEAQVEVFSQITTKAARTLSYLGTPADHVAGLRCDTNVRHSRFTSSGLHDGPAVSRKFCADLAAP